MAILRPVCAVLAAAAVAIGGCTRAVDGAPSDAPATSTPPSIPPASPAPSGTGATATPRPQYESCNQLLHLPGETIPPSLLGKLTVECIAVPTPLDYADASRGTVSVTVVRIHDSENSGDTPLIANPGGPGGSATEFVLGLLPRLSPTILRHYDLVGFDPRGVNQSAPVQCLSNARKDRFLAASPDVATPAGLAAAKGLARQFAQACAKHEGSSLRWFDTVDTARDMDYVRAALHAPKTNYLGFSYGTELGSVYAHYFPSHVGVMVLDGALAPGQHGVTQASGQLQGFEKAFDQFAAGCTSGDCVAPAHARRVAERIEAAATRHPLPTGVATRPLTYALAATGILEALYSPSSWPALAAALRDGAGGNGAKLLALADRYNRRKPDGHYGNLLDAGTAISCNDTAPGPSEATIRRLVAQWLRDYPIFGRWFAISIYSCQQWQPHRTVPPEPTAPTRTKVLVVGNVHDPATPYEGAKELTRVMGNAELLSLDGAGHTSYLAGSSCIDGQVEAYLLHATLPPLGTVCR